MISHKHRCIFIHIPKCAGTSIESVLGHHMPNISGTIQDHRPVNTIINDSRSGLKYLDKLFNQQRQRILFSLGLRNDRNPNNRRIVSRRQFEQYFKFSFVRNPWSRAYSWYRHVMREERLQTDLDCGPDMGFDAFVYKYCGDNNLRTQLSWIMDESGNIPLDFIGRFENLDRDFRHVSEKLGLGTVQLPHKLDGGSGNYRKAYDNKLKNFVGDFYSREIELFGYDF